MYLISKYCCYYLLYILYSIFDRKDYNLKLILLIYFLQSRYFLLRKSKQVKSHIILGDNRNKKGRR